jgi:pectate lyase-like protein
VTISIREQQDAANNTAVTRSFTLGSGTEIGDTLLVIAANNSDTMDNLLDPTGTAATTWSLEDSFDGGIGDNHVKIWTAPVTTAGAETVSVGETLQDSFYAGVWVLEGEAAFASADWAETDIQSASAVAPSLTPPEDVTGGLLVTLFGTRADNPINITPPGGMTPYTERDVSGVNTYRAASEQLTSDSPTGARTATLSFNRHNFAVSVLMAPPVAPPPPPPPPPSDAYAWDDHFANVRGFGTVGDYVVATGAGTDDTAAIQAAIDSTVTGGVNEGKMTLLAGGRYKTTAPLVVKQGTSLMSAHLVRTSAVGSQVTKYGVTIDFHGGPADNAIQAIGTTQQSVSRCAVQGFKIVDRRVNPTGGSGVYFEKVVNQSVIRHMDIHGFPTGSSVRITAQSGNSSDCLTIEDIWALGSQYGINVNKIDNTCFIRDIKIDSLSTQPLLAGIRVSEINGVVLINGVKHENSKATAVTIQLDTIFMGTVIDGVISRVGAGGPVVSITGTNVGSGVTVRGLQRQQSGTLLEVGGNTITGTRLPFWVGGSDGIWINGAQIVGQFDIWGLLNLPSALKLSSAPPTGRMGFYGKTPVARPVLNYSRAIESAADTQLRTALDALGLITDSTTA